MSMASISPAENNFELSPAQLWEKEIEGHTEFHRITDSNLDFFCEVLSADYDVDSYNTSPTYYLITGRKGLWVYFEKDTLIPLCWHPNVLDKILLFPMRGGKDPEVLRRLIEKMPEPPAGFQAVRVKRDDETYSSSESLLLSKSIDFVPVQELVLDWRFPVRILSTQKLMELTGNEFKRIRNHVRQITEQNIVIEDLSLCHRPALEEFLERWISKNTDKKHEVQEFLRFYHQMMDLVSDVRLGLCGLVFLIDDRIEAFSIWDVSNGNRPSANRYANLCNYGYRGLAEYTTHYISGILTSKGVPYLNLGGSETPNLDEFKNKFVPAISIELHSVEIVIHDEMLPQMSPNLQTVGA